MSESRRKKTTRLMIEKFRLMELKYDFMGYPFKSLENLSYHHMIIARKDFRMLKLPDMHSEWNCAILNQSTSHNYLHTIARYDYDVFSAITLEMIYQNLQGTLDLESLKKINDFLAYFEREYRGKYSDQGNLIVKDIYLQRVLNKKI